MSALRACLAAVVFALVLAAPAAAQQRERMHPDLVRQLREEEVQRAANEEDEVQRAANEEEEVQRVLAYLRERGIQVAEGLAGGDGGKA